MLELTKRELLLAAGGAALAPTVTSVWRVEAKMIEPKTVSENIMYSTARIVGLDQNGKEFKFGTGFFYRYPVDTNRSVWVLVTNKHVIEDTKQTAFVVHTISGDGSKPDGNKGFKADTGQWIPHPDDNIDLCALPVAAIANSTNPRPFFKGLEPSLIPTQAQLEELDAVEDILMVGYPNGLWDEVNNYPLIRRGITASHPAVDYQVENVAATVLDAACFPGSSGSPVLIYNPGAYANKTGGLVIGGRTFFLGILFKGPVIRTDGQIVIRNIPTNMAPVAEISLMMNLGYIIKSRELTRLGTNVFDRLGVK